MRVIQRNMVTNKLLVHRRLSSSPDEVVKKERLDEQSDNQASKEPTDPEKDPMASVGLVGCGCRSHTRAEPDDGACSLDSRGSGG